MTKVSHILKVGELSVFVAHFKVEPSSTFPVLIYECQEPGTKSPTPHPFHPSPCRGLEDSSLVGGQEGEGDPKEKLLLIATNLKPALL